MWSGCSVHSDSWRDRKSVSATSYPSSLICWSCYCFCCSRHPRKCAKWVVHAVLQAFINWRYNKKGLVVEMGLTSTSLLNAEKFPVIVPNSLFSCQIIVNKSRAEWRGIINKIPL